MNKFRESLNKNDVKLKIISANEARQMMKDLDNYILLDVRTPSEYSKIRIPGAKLIPVDELIKRAAFEFVDELPDKHIPILVYCQSGMRAKIAAKILIDMGYTGVVSFGGIANWTYETVRDKGDNQ